MLTNIRFYNVVGGSGHGKTLNHKYLPDLEDGDKVWVHAPDVDYGEHYQLRGNTLYYLQRDSIRYVDGPCDGMLCQEDETVKDGDAAVVPMNDGTYAWYHRQGDRLYYAGNSTYDELEKVQEAIA